MKSNKIDFYKETVKSINDDERYSIAQTAQLMGIDISTLYGLRSKRGADAPISQHSSYLGRDIRAWMNEKINLFGIDLSKIPEEKQGEVAKLLKVLDRARKRIDLGGCLIISNACDHKLTISLD